MRSIQQDERAGNKWQNSDSLTSAQESGQVSPLLESSPEALNSSDSQKLTTTVGISFSNDSPISPSLETLKPILGTIPKAHFGEQKESISSPLHPPVSPSVSKENAKEPPTNETVSPPLLEQLSQSNLDSSALKTFQDCSVVPISLVKPLGHISAIFSGRLTSAGTMRNGLLYQADTLAAPSLEKDCFWLESPGALSSGQGRPPGQSRLEGQLKKLGVLERQEVLNPQYLEKAYSLPLDWTNPQESKAATELLGIDEKPLETHSIQEWPALPSKESSISIPSNSFLGESDPPIFLGENSEQEDRTLQISPKKKTDDHLASEIFLGENDQPQTMKQISPKKNPSGSLYAFIQDKKNKYGAVKTYPKVVGERDLNNPNHWFWAYCWDEKVNGKWKTFKRSVAREKLEAVRRAIASNQPVLDILKIIG